MSAGLTDYHLLLTKAQLLFHMTVTSDVAYRLISLSTCLPGYLKEL